MKDIQYKILWSTIEDFVGLWEINWEINSSFPYNTISQNRSITKKILLFFLRNNLINVYYSTWGSNELRIIKKTDAIKIINEGNFWEAPKFNELCIKIGNTKKGAEYYNGEMMEDFVL